MWVAGWLSTGEFAVAQFGGVRALGRLGYKGWGIEGRIVTWAEVLAIVAALAAAGSLGVAYKAYRISALQALPHPNIAWVSSSTGRRSLDFEIKRASGDPDWVVTRASMRGNWRRQRYLALGSLEHMEELEGEMIKSYGPYGPWQRCIDFTPPVTEGAIVLHPETPECEVKLVLTLRTSPSPKVVRRIRVKIIGPRP